MLAYCRIGSALAALFLAYGHAFPAAAAETLAWPTRAWAESSPEAQGLDARVLETLHREFAEGKHGYIDGMLVIRNGAVVFEKAYRHDYDTLFVGKGAPALYNYYDPEWHPYWKRGPLHTMQSVSKSVTSTLVGIAIQRGEIPGVEVPVMSYFADFKVPPDARRDAMTLRHVLTMTTGIAWDESSVAYTDPRNNCAVMEGKEDWVQYVLEQPMAQAPGLQWQYNSGATQLLSFLIKKTTGKEADDYAKERLFGPLGIEYAWKRTPRGLADTEGGLYLRPRDLAKLGYLFLKDGVWEGKRILPEGWVKEATTRQVELDGGGAYGYKWWIAPRQEPGSPAAYAAIGYGGQLLIVVPDLQLLAVFTGWNIYDRQSLKAFVAKDRIVAAVKAAAKMPGAAPR
jgi:CubicO group peptidase (beta-lactamase class C family)